MTEGISLDELERIEPYQPHIGAPYKIVQLPEEQWSAILTALREAEDAKKELEFLRGYAAKDIEQERQTESTIRSEAWKAGRDAAAAVCRARKSNNPAIEGTAATCLAAINALQPPQEDNG